MSKTETKIPKSILTVAWVMVFGAMAPLLDSTMMNIAIQSLTKDLNSTIVTVQWTITGYVLATAVAVPFSGWLVDRFDGKYVFLAGEIIFLIGSVMSAMSGSIAWLIFARLIQGFGGGIIMPLLTTLLVQTAGGNMIGRLMATVGLPMILGPILGPVVGGVIIKYLNWHWIFWVNVPIALISVVSIILKMPNFKPQNVHKQMDYIGILLLATSSATIIYGIVKASRTANFNNSQTILFVGIGIALLVLYFIWAIFKKGKAVLPLTLFTHQTFDATIIAMLLSGMVLNGPMLLLPLYFQQVRGISVLNAGLALIPQGIGMLISRPTVGRLIDEIGAKYIVIISLSLSLFTTIPFVFFTDQTSLWLIGLVMLVRGIGVGGILTPIMSDAYVGMQHHEIPAASVGSRIAQNIGSAFGSAVVTTAISAYANDKIASFKQALQMGKFHVNQNQLPELIKQQSELIRMHSIQHGFYIMILLSLIMFIPTLFLTNKITKKTD